MKKFKVLQAVMVGVVVFLVGIFSGMWTRSNPPETHGENHVTIPKGDENRYNSIPPEIREAAESQVLLSRFEGVQITSLEDAYLLAPGTKVIVDFTPRSGYGNSRMAILGEKPYRKGSKDPSVTAFATTIGFHEVRWPELCMGKPLRVWGVVGDYEGVPQVKALAIEPMKGEK